MKKNKVSALAFCLLFGIFSITLSYNAFKFIASPTLFLRLAPTSDFDEKRILLRLFNYGDRDLVLDSTRLKYFLYVPDSPNQKYSIQIRAGDGEYTRKSMGDAQKQMVRLRPEDNLEVGNVYPLLTQLPPGEVLLNAIFTTEENGVMNKEVWQGTVVSMPLALELTKN